MSTREMLEAMREQEAVMSRLRSELELAIVWLDIDRWRLVEEACEEHQCVFVPSGWMGLVLPWFYRPHDPAEKPEPRETRAKELDEVLEKLRP